MEVYSRIKRWLNDENNISTAKIAIYYIVCQLLVRGMAFITTPIFSRMLTKEEYGYVSNFLAWEGILFPIITLNLRASINKSKYDFTDDNNEYLSSILFMAILSTTVFYFLVEINQSFFIKIFDMDIRCIRILFIYMLFLIAFDFQQIQYNIFRKYKTYVLYSLGNVILTLSLSVILVITLTNRMLGRLLGIMLPMVFVGSLIYCMAFRKGKSIKFKYIKYALLISLPLLPSAFSSNILSISDRVMITHFWGNSETAMYSIPYSVSGIAAIAFTALNQAWAPWLLDNLKNENFHTIKKRAISFSCVYAYIIIGLMLLSPEIVLLLGGKQYMDAVNVMPPVIMAMVCQYLYSFYFDTEYFYGETFVISIGTFLAAIINIILNFMFIPQYGYVVASYTTLVGYAAMLIYHFSIVKFKLKKSFIFPTKWFVVLLLFLSIMQLLVMQMYNIYLLRYIVVGLYIMGGCIIIWKNKKIFIGMFKRK